MTTQRTTTKSGEITPTNIDPTTPGSDEPLLYTIDGAAQRLSVSRVTLYREHSRGALDFVRLRGRTMVAASELRRYTDALPIESAP